MIIASIHNTACSWSASTIIAWNEKRYFSSICQAVVSRVLSAALVIFQLLFAPVFLVITMIDARQLFTDERDLSVFTSMGLAIKVLGVALGILSTGIFQSILSTAIPEVMYGHAKFQKGLYAMHIVNHVDLFEGLSLHKVMQIQQRLSELSLHFEEHDFQQLFRQKWLSHALAQNSASPYGNYLIDDSFDECVESCFKEYAETQLNRLLEIDSDQYAVINARMNQNRAVRRNSDAGAPQPRNAVVRALRQPVNRQNTPEVFCKKFKPFILSAAELINQKQWQTTGDISSCEPAALVAITQIALLHMFKANKSNVIKELGEKQLADLVAVVLSTESIVDDVFKSNAPYIEKNYQILLIKLADTTKKAEEMAKVESAFAEQFQKLTTAEVSVNKTLDNQFEALFKHIGEIGKPVLQIIGRHSQIWVPGLANLQSPVAAAPRT